MRKQFLVVLMSLLSLAIGCGSGGSSAGDGFGSTTPFQTGSGTGTAKLAWDAPTINADGTPLTGLAGYKIHIGISSGIYTATIDAGNVTSYSINHLINGNYYFTVTAYNTDGVESDYSNEVNKTI